MASVANTARGCLWRLCIALARRDRGLCSCDEEVNEGSATEDEDNTAATDKEEERSYTEGEPPYIDGILQEHRRPLLACDKVKTSKMQRPISFTIRRYYTYAARSVLSRISK